MRYRPETVTAAILAVAARRSAAAPDGTDARRLLARPPRPRHHARDVHGRRRPGERGRRARRDHPAALEADGGFRTEPTEHGEAPITAVHDPGLVRFLEVAWSSSARSRSRGRS